MADDLPAPRPGWFSLTVLYTVHETCRMCDVVMDTLKKNHTIQAFHTAHIVLDRETNSNVTSHYIKAFVLPNMRQLFSSILFSFFFLFLLLAIQRENFVCYCREMTQAQSPCISFKHFKRKKKPSFKHFVAAPYRASPTLDHILLLAEPAGWCCVWCHGPSARGPGLNFPWQLKSALLRCPSDSRLQRCSFEETEDCN